MKSLLIDQELNGFDEKIFQREGRPLHALQIDAMQVNIGLVCNLQCVHCHVAAGPKRTEQMDWETMVSVLSAAKRIRCRMIDITGGAPEMNPHFKKFIQELRSEGFWVQVRTNLTVLLLPEYEDTLPFMAEQKVGLIASLPCYLEDNVDTQRGRGTYRASIQALQRLNEHGYGIKEDLPLHLIYNPVGPGLPPRQNQLEEVYRRELDRRFGIRFNQLFTITNMPIGRFLADLKRAKKDREYLHLLKDKFNPQTLSGLMCRHHISIDWQGVIHDCDFNLALRLPVNHGVPNRIQDFDWERLAHRQIVTGEHCFGCTAGCGSSCGGSLVTIEESPEPSNFLEVERI